MDKIVTRDLRVVASRGIEGSEARKRRREKATPPRDMEWESGRDAGRRRVKFPKRLLPAESHLLPRLEDSSRAERSSAEENRLGRSVRDRNSAARSRGNPDRRLGEIVQNRGRNLMAQAIREANHGRMRQAEIASRMRRNPQDSNRGARSRGRQNPGMASLRHDHALLEKQEIGLSRGNVTVEKREKGRRGKNRMASLLDLSRRDLRARDSNLLAHDLLKRDRLTANRELRERSPGHRKARVRGLAAQNLTKRVPLVSRSARLAARSHGPSDPLPRMAKDRRPNAAIEKKPLERGRARRAAPSHSGLKIRGAGKVRRQRAAAIVRKASMRRERAARRNDRDLPRNGGIGAATAAPGDCH